ncbi:MAG TPA: hypothetical protein VF576_11520 [Rubricoccaceae bacterium]
MPPKSGPCGGRRYGTGARPDDRLLFVAAFLASAATAPPPPDPTFADVGFALVKLQPSAAAWAVAEAPHMVLSEAERNEVMQGLLSRAGFRRRWSR